LCINTYTYIHTQTSQASRDLLGIISVKNLNLKEDSRFIVVTEKY
jgi:hypothetical protein